MVLAYTCVCGERRLAVICHSGQEQALELWWREMERLPECIVLRILTGLPLRCSIRLRLVCKAWNALLRCSFLLQTLTPPHPLSCFVLAPPPQLTPHFCHHSRFLLFIPGLSIWLHSHFLLPRSSSTMPALDSVMRSAAHRHLVAICTSQVIRVFHLLTSSHYDITPPLPHDLSLPPFPETMSMSMSSSPWSNLFIFCDDDDESYQLVLTKQHHSLFIYSSKHEAWRSVSTPFRRSFVQIEGDKADELFLNPTVGAGGADLVFWNVKECMLATYYIESDTWKKIQVRPPRPEEFRGTHREYLALSGGAVFECQGGRVVMVCAVVKDELVSESLQLTWRLIKGFRVWDLQTTTQGFKQWMQVASAPASFWEAYYSLEYAEPEFRPKFIHDGTCICMTSAKHISSSQQQKPSPFTHNKFGRYRPPLVYDLHLDSWSYLPRHSEEADDLVGLFTFKPPSLTHLALHNNTRIIYSST